MSEILNANPTIRNTSDLPSRRRQLSSQASSKSPLSLFASTVPTSAYLPDPFSPATSDPEDSDPEDDSVDPIDEQEIYGIASSTSYLTMTSYLHVSISSPPINLQFSKSLFYPTNQRNRSNCSHRWPWTPPDPWLFVRC